MTSTEAQPCTLIGAWAGAWQHGEMHGQGVYKYFDGTLASLGKPWMSRRVDVAQVRATRASSIITSARAMAS